MKRKQRKKRQTILIYCEGKTEQTFVKHLQKLFTPTSKVKNRRIKIKKGHGGGSSSLTQKVKN